MLFNQITQTEETRSQNRIQSLIGDVTTNKKPFIINAINKKTKRIKRNENKADSDDSSPSAANEEQVSADNNNSPTANEEKAKLEAEIYSTYIIGAAKAVRDSLNSKNKADDDQIQRDVNDLFQFENELGTVII